MPLAFSEIGTLLSRLEDIELHYPPILYPADKSARLKEITESWFKSHRRQINELDVNNAVALLSTLLPERRTDRVYGTQSARLCRILGRGLNLRSAHCKDLEAHKQSARGDLAICLERVLKSGGPPALPTVYLDDVDKMLDILAGNCRFSEHTTKLPQSSSEQRDKLVGNIFKRLDPVQSKWLVRLILKDFSPVRLNETLVLHSFHFLLPDLLRFQSNFDAAIRLLKGALKEYPDNPDPRSQRLHRQRAAALLEPVVGVKVGRPNFYKARSIDNCINMCRGQRWVLERKYDGEYCEIHIDMRRSHTPSECITIFSKSGKNSTEDRQGLHQTLVDCLHLGKSESKIKRQAIILSELVVYSDRERRIVPFEKVRKYVSRSGVFLGTDEDSQQHEYEHLAIVFFDLLLLDDEIVMRRPLNERRMWLREIYSKADGRAMGAEWKIIDFGHADRAKNVLIQQFAASVADRREGLVLKPCDMPYFNLDQTATDYINGYIKLKKDYIAGMGDEADFAVVGGSYKGQQALKSGLANLRWTDFHIGCLLNEAEVLRFDARPRFKIVGTIQADHCIPKPVLQAANALGRFSANPYTPGDPPAKFDVEFSNLFKIDVVFNDPFVFEVLGSGFEKPPNCNYLMLRHPRVKKLHQDRTWKDCVSLQELQEQATAARAAPPGSESQETKRLIARLEAKCKKKIERQRTSTPRSRTTTTPTTASQPPTSGSTRMLRSNQRTICAGVTTSPITDPALDGTTLVSWTSCRSKRPRQEPAETPCPAAKKQRTEKPKHKPFELGNDTLEDKTASPKTTPLSDITNTAPYASSSPIAVKNMERTAKSDKSRFPPSELSIRLETKQKTRNRQENQCTSPKCLFANTVIFAASCIATTPYIVEELLRAHDIVTVPTLAHWDRDSFAHAPMTEIVSESQAFEGMRKIVLVESKRSGAVKETTRPLRALNDGRWRERVEVYDWRILEACADHELGAAESKGYFLGATMFDEGEGRTIFVEDTGRNALLVNALEE